MRSYRAYTSGQMSRTQAERYRTESERRRAVANRCTGRRKSTATNPLPCVYQPIGNGDLMGCKHCPHVRQLTNAEYRAKYGVDRPPPRPAPRRRTFPLWALPVPLLGVVVVAGQSGSAAMVAAVGVGLVVLLVAGRRSFR